MGSLFSEKPNVAFDIAAVASNVTLAYIGIQSISFAPGMPAIW